MPSSTRAASRRPAPGAPLAAGPRRETVVHIADIAARCLTEPAIPDRRALVELGGARTSWPCRCAKTDASARRDHDLSPGGPPFTDKQIALLQNFAAQAVIAMENARLITETREALEQQTATAEVLQVINSSPGDLAPVFDAMLEKAHRLAGRPRRAWGSTTAKNFRAVAMHGYSREFAERVAAGRTAAPTIRSRIAARRRALRPHSPIWREIDASEWSRGVPSRLGGVRTVPVCAAAQGRRPARLYHRLPPGSPPVHRQADRAAAEFRGAGGDRDGERAADHRDARGLGAADRDRRGVAGHQFLARRSRAGVRCDARKGERLCGAAFGDLWTFDGERFPRGRHARHAASFAEFAAAAVIRAGPGQPSARLLRGERFVHIADCAETRRLSSDDPMRRALSISAASARCCACRCARTDVLLGVFTIYRQEVRPFTDKQIALLQNFAAQAVIAMENARLITETREALEQQTATAEVLQVINSSPGDLAPVFDAMLEKAHALCGAAFGSLSTYRWRVLPRGRCARCPPLLRGSDQRERVPAGSGPPGAPADRGERRSSTCPISRR